MLHRQKRSCREEQIKEWLACSGVPPVGLFGLQRNPAAAGRHSPAGMALPGVQTFHTPQRGGIPRSIPGLLDKVARQKTLISSMDPVSLPRFPQPAG